MRLAALFPAASALVPVATMGAAFAPGDPVAGEKAFKKCEACRSVEAGKVKPTGPNPLGAFGRQAGTVEFRLERSMVEAGEAGLFWTPELMDAHIADPKAFLKETLGASKVAQQDDLQAEEGGSASRRDRLSDVASGVAGVRSSSRAFQRTLPSPFRGRGSGRTRRGERTVPASPAQGRPPVPPIAAVRSFEHRQRIGESRTRITRPDDCRPLAPRQACCRSADEPTCFAQIGTAFSRSGRCPGAPPQARPTIAACPSRLP